MSGGDVADQPDPEPGTGPTVDWPAGSFSDEDADEPTVGADAQNEASSGVVASDAAATDDASDPHDAVLSDDEFTVETLVLTLEEVTSERDSHLNDLQRMTADFSNFRKQATKRQGETVTNAAASVVEKLLPVLDACEAALAQGSEDVQPIFNTLMDVLGREGLAHINPVDQAFDPEQHEAVMHEPGEGEAVVAEVLRTGYAWNGKVIRPAMVKVQG